MRLIANVRLVTQKYGITITDWLRVIHYACAAIHVAHSSIRGTYMYSVKYHHLQLGAINVFFKAYSSCSCKLHCFPRTCTLMCSVNRVNFKPIVYLLVLGHIPHYSCVLELLKSLGVMVMFMFRLEVDTTRQLKWRIP